MHVEARIITSNGFQTTAEFLLYNTLGLPAAKCRHPRLVQIVKGAGVFQIGETVYKYDLSTEGVSVFYIPSNTTHQILPLTATLVRATQYYGAVPKE
jgi:hypothetical protein